MSHHKKRRIPTLIGTLFVIFLCFLSLTIFLGVRLITTEVSSTYGAADDNLSLLGKAQYTLKLYLDGAILLTPISISDSETFFEIAPGETVGQIAFRLQDEGFISDADLFRSYLIYRGYDRLVQSGFFRITSGMDALSLADRLIDPMPGQVEFTVLAGWRAEEIAASLPRSGLAIDPQDFMDLVMNPPSDWFAGEFTLNQSLEGYLGTGSYILDREISLQEFVRKLTNRFDENLNSALRNSIEQQGLTLHETVILASIVEREAVISEEMPLIASVFLNRYRSGIKLDSDPTVQYAVGYNAQQSSWWTNPLSANDLQIDSLYNTYLYGGLPPTPICNPSLEAIQAVVFAQDSPYYYFRARCDGSGYHNFSETYAQHLQYGCP